jgi:imidazoleglycerol phosphate synthase glutamine amidotransferase subunit HisH
MPTVHLLDYVAGNVRSLVNAINKVGYDVEWIKSPEDVKNAEVRESSFSEHWSIPRACGDN